MPSLIEQRNLLSILTVYFCFEAAYCSSTGVSIRGQNAATKLRSLRSERSTPCSYGTLPGTWLEDAEPGSKWHLLDPDCQMDNYLQAYINGSRVAEPPTGILFLADSVDRYLVSDWCSEVGGEWVRHEGDGSSYQDRYGLNLCKGSPSHVNLAQYFVLGVSPAPPFCFGLHHSFRERTAAAHKDYVRQFGHEPGLVVLGANLWDIGRIQLVRDVVMSKHPHIPLPVLHQWMANLTQWAQLTRDTFPEGTMIAFHTMPLIHEDRKTGNLHTAVQGKRSYIVQLNAAGRQVARQQGMFLVDVADMVMENVPLRYLRDGEHPNKEVNGEALNVYLNLLHQALQPEGRRGH